MQREGRQGSGVDRGGVLAAPRLLLTGAGRGAAQRRLIAALCVLAGALLISGASAQAALVHPYLSQITGTKPPTKLFSGSLCGLGVDPGSSEVYVADPEGTPGGIFMFDGAGALVNKLSKKLGAPCSTAVDDSLHRVYVANPGEGEKPPKTLGPKSAAVFVFDNSAPGEPKLEEALSLTGADTPGKSFVGVGEEGEQLEAGAAINVAVAQSSGLVYVSVAEQHVVDVFDPKAVTAEDPEGYVRQLTFPTSNNNPPVTPLSVATNPSGDVYVVVEATEGEGGVENTVVDEFNPAGQKIAQITGGSAGGFGALTGLAVDGSGRLYVSDGGKRAVDEYDASNAFMGTITGAGVPAGSFADPIGVGVNPAGDVYVADRPPPGQPGQGSVDMFGPATAGAGPFLIDDGASEVTASGATLEARIDPTGVDTKYHFEYTPEGGTTVETPEEDAGSGESIKRVSVELSGLQANTHVNYHVVVNPSGHAPEEGTIRQFTTQTEGAGLPDGRAWELVTPTNKLGALIFGIQNTAGTVQASVGGDRIAYYASSPLEPEVEGNASTTSPALSRRGSETWSTKQINPPDYSPTGFAGLGGAYGRENRIYSADLTRSIVHPFRSEPPLSPDATELTPYIRDLNDSVCNIKEPFCYTPLLTTKEGIADVNSGEKFGNKETQAPFFPIVVAGASPDLSHVVLDAEVTLIKEVNGHPVGEREGLPSLGVDPYEWSADKPATERLQLVDVLPNGELPGSDESAGLGYAHQTDPIYRNAISTDGSRVTWTTSHGGQGESLHIYMRQMVKGETVQLDAPEAGAPAPGEFAEPKFQTASADGSMVFFTDQQRLTEDATASGAKPDLYAAQIVEEGGKLVRSKLTDLTADSPSESANVLGIIPGASEDGSYVYFIANGALTGNAAKGNCGPLAPPGASCNLYMRHFDEETGTWEATALVAVLSNEDQPDWAGESDALTSLTSRVSPNGQYLAFMSDRSLTGYDNSDASPEAGGAADEEVFRYGAPASANPGLVCASCNPSGGRPHGYFEPHATEAPLIDKEHQWDRRWLAANIPAWTGVTQGLSVHQSRYLSDSGRMFFNSADALVHSDKNSTQDVYEYEPDGEGSCALPSGCQALISSGESDQESAFLDASETGDDVFILTSSNLVTDDIDQSRDIYDAHVCSDASPCLPGAHKPPPPCDSPESCQGSPPAPAGPSGAPGSSNTGASGNVSGVVVQTPKGQTLPNTVKKLTKAQQLSKALKACHKMKAKKKRAKCEASARKKWGPKKKAKKNAKKSSGQKK